jgi:Uma2 family endonuclease
MATKAQITAEQYLHMTFEYDAEFVRGEVIERALPDILHSMAQFRVSMRFAEAERDHRLFTCLGVRMRLAEDLYRVADVAALSSRPLEDYPERPPLVLAEIIAPGDRHHDLMEKLEEYRVWGVPNIWVVDPISKRLSLYTESGLRTVSSLALSEYPLEITPAILFSDL